jgi:predicted DNA-binding ribbon-helix-helix protein
MRGLTMMKSSIVKRSIVIDGHKTSVSLEDAFWTVLKDIAHAECVAVSKIVADIDKKRKLGNLSSALRLFVLDRTRAGGLPIPRAPLRAFAGEGSQKSSAQTVSSLAPDAM